MCQDLCDALNKAGLKYEYKYLKNKEDLLLKTIGTIVFIRFSKTYPRGHYLVKTQCGWMNPWSNFPEISPAKSAYNRILPGEPIYIVFENHN